MQTKVAAVKKEKKKKGVQEYVVLLSLHHLTITFALLLWVRVVKKSLPVVSPGHAAELDSLQSIVQENGAFHPEEVDLHPVRPACAGAVRQVLPVLRECISFKDGVISV